MVKKWITYKVKICMLKDIECNNGDRLDYKSKINPNCNTCDIYLNWKQKNDNGED